MQSNCPMAFNVIYLQIVLIKYKIMLFIRNRRKQYKNNVVILHGYRGITCPSVSQFVLKLETYLRIATIPYEFDFEEPFGPKGKSPWITYNGVDVTDSAFCIQYLNNQFSINLNSKLTLEEAAISRCFMLAAENNFALSRRKQYKKDVILHQFQRGTTCPSLSPFILKLETYLRIVEIPYECDFEEPFGPKGKSPWITYNDVDVADSTFCINYLNEQFAVNLNSKLRLEEAAISRCFMLTAENNFVLCCMLWRFLYDKELSVFKLSGTSFPIILQMFPSIMRRYARKIGFYHGIGRHSEQEVYDIGVQDLNAFSAYLGKKRFFMGDEVSEVDCTMFGVLAQCVWSMPNSPFEAALNGELTNLKQFCFRMKDAFWKDWDDVIIKKYNAL